MQQYCSYQLATLYLGMWTPNKTALRSAAPLFSACLLASDSEHCSHRQMWPQGSTTISTWRGKSSKITRRDIEKEGPLLGLAFRTREVHEALTSLSRQTLQTNLESGLPTDEDLLLAMAMGGVAGCEVEFLLSGVAVRGARAARTTLKRGQ